MWRRIGMSSTAYALKTETFAYRRRAAASFDKTRCVYMCAQKLQVYT